MHRDGRDFQDTNGKVSESWARGVEWDLTRMVYSNDESGYLGRSRQINDYALVVADMLDRGAIEATRINDGYINSDNVDFVENYTVRQIEDALKGKLTWDDWRLSIFNMFDNNTENNLELLFEAYE
jgi:hypothetical protein